MQCSICIILLLPSLCLCVQNQFYLTSFTMIVRFLDPLTRPMPARSASASFLTIFVCVRSILFDWVNNDIIRFWPSLCVWDDQKANSVLITLPCEAWSQAKHLSKGISFTMKHSWGTRTHTKDTWNGEINPKEFNSMYSNVIQGNFSGPPNFSTKKKTIPIMAAVPVNLYPVSKKGCGWLFFLVLKLGVGGGCSKKNTL